jgi:hypothetical protein
MDKPRHPNVIRTWQVRQPVRVVPPIKDETAQRNRKRRVPQPQRPGRRSQTEKPPQSA